MGAEELKALEAAVEAGDISDVNRVLGKIFYTDHSLPWERVSNVNSACRGSLDAAKALYEAVLPGWGFEVAITPLGGPRAVVWRVGHKEMFDASAPDLARAWLLAIIRALIAEWDSKE